MNNLYTWKYHLLIVSLVLFSFNVYAQSKPWTKKADLPNGIGSASAVDGKIYIAGGSVLPSIADVAYNRVYDPSTDTWEEKTPVPTPRGFLTTAVVNDTIFAIGGGYPAAKKAVEAYAPATDTWTKKQDMLNNRLGMDAAVVNGIIYIFGGNYTSRNCEAFDPATNTWTKKTDMPEGGGVVSVTAYNGLIYVFGGGYYSSYSFVQVYNPQTDAWTKKEDMPTPRFAFQTFLVNEKIYALGGVKSEGGASLATVEVYDPVADIWETRSNMPLNLAWFTGAVVNDKIYIIGGVQSWASNANVSVWEYDPSLDTPVSAGNVSETTFNLEQNYPNPFSSVTTIKYTVPVASKVAIKIYDLIGKEIETLLNEEKPTGTYEVTWQARNLPGGIYFYQLNSGGLVETKKMILRR